MNNHYYRKLRLLDENDLDNLIQKRLKEYNPVLNTMAKMELEKNDILTDPKLTTEDKLAQYQAITNRFQTLENEYKGNHLSTLNSALEGRPEQNVLSNSRLSVAKEDLNNEEMSQPAEADHDTSVEDSLISPKKTFSPVARHTRGYQGKKSFPKARLDIKARHAPKFSRLAKLLEENPEIIRPISETGEVAIYDQPISGSNYNDLISELYGHHSGRNLKGQTEFLSGLNMLLKTYSPGTPYEAVITNQKILREVNQKGKGLSSMKQIRRHNSTPGKRVKFLYLYKP